MNLLLAQSLEKWVVKYEQISFIENDPISIPHAFSNPRDQEIIGLFAALLAWGQRKTILKKMVDLCERMDYQPARFVLHFDAYRDRTKLSDFKHRTFNEGDAFWLILNLQSALRQYGSIEAFFGAFMSPDDEHVEQGIQGFSSALMKFHEETPNRLQKHLARPSTKSACKRINMYLRWMVRQNSAVDLGIWKSISPRQLLLPLDVHSGRVARRLGCLTRPQDDWQATLALSNFCRSLDANDPAKYDFAFFGLGVNGDLNDTTIVL